MESLSPARIAAALLLALPLVACGPTAEEDRAKSGPIVGPFLVSNFYTPSGLMGDGATPDRVTVDINKNCKDRLKDAQGDCYRFTYVPGTVHWAGAFWSFPANNWGSTRGRPVIGPIDLMVTDPDKPTAGNLHGYHRARVKFAMCADPNGCPCGPNNSLLCPKLKPNDLHFWAGKLDGRMPPADGGPPQPYYDEGCVVLAGTVLCSTDQTIETTNPDGSKGTKTVKVPYFFNPGETTKTADPDDPATIANGGWASAEVDLSMWAPQRVIGGFGFSTNDEMNKENGVGKPQVIYLDDIVWE